MEYLDGPTLQQETRKAGALPYTRMMAVVAQLADALDYAHQQGLVHRDVKPANIIIGSQDHITLTDFGLVKAARGSKITGEGAAMGTLKYMSPEQAVGKDLDSRSDIYSLGVVVYEMLTSEPPFTGTTPYQTLHELVYEPPPSLLERNPGVKPEVEQVVFKALSKEPGKRFSTAGEFARALAKAGGVGESTVWRVKTDALEREVVLRLITSDGREFPVYRGRVTIGRDTGNDIVIPVQQVSRRHARIQCSQTGCRVMDMGSTNGTSVNGVRIVPRQPNPLQPGDVLDIGPVTLLATRPSASDQLDPSTLSMEPKRD
jgi:serine/threonine-protein kinase